jgi:hypothetical protein
MATRLTWCIAAFVCSALACRAWGQAPATAATRPAVETPARQSTVLIRAGERIPALRSNTAYLFERGGVWEAQQIRILFDHVTLGSFGEPSQPLPILRCTAKGDSAEFIRSERRDLVIEHLALDSAFTDVHGISLRGARDVVIRGITATRLFSYVVIAREDSAGVTLIESTFPRLKGHALYSTMGCRDIRVLGNTFGGSEWEHTVRTYSSDTRIAGNTFHKPRWEVDGRLIPLKGLCVRGGRRIVIEDNTFDGDGMQIDLGALSKEPFVVEGLTFRRNRCSYGQFQLFYGVTDLLIEDCELETQHQDAISIRATSFAQRLAPTGIIRSTTASSRGRFLGGSPHNLLIGPDVSWNGHPVPMPPPASAPAQEQTPAKPGS